jgi:hypothetical protein
MRDSGSMLVFVVMVGVAVTGAVTMALVPVLSGIVERQQAQSAADAAALAGVTGGRAASLSIAAANEGAVIAWSRSGHEVTVTVQVGERRATARATDAP